MKRLVRLIILSLLLVLLAHGFLLEVCEVSSGSMAPALAGRHRSICCPNCGATVQVGLHPGEHDPGKQSRTFARAHCWNCGHADLGLEKCPDLPGQRVLVDKTAFLIRQPQRWQIVVFRLFGFVFIKRIIGLPGETVEIRDGDIWVNGELVRKTLAQFHDLRIPVFDSTHPPDGLDGRKRWEADPAAGSHPLVGKELYLDGAGSGQSVTYCQYFWEEQKSAALRDEYAYDGNQCLPTQHVHDFMLECDVAVAQGEGCVQFQISDGADTVIAEIPITSRTEEAALGVLRARNGTIRLRGDDRNSPSGGGHTPARVFFRPGSCYHVQMAFVDRRATLRVGAREAILDLPAVAAREGVSRPVALGIRGGKAVIRHFRLFRDVHYTSAGRNGVGGKAVHLAVDQYFVLGDNSPVSEDSRFWPDQGAVPTFSLIGRPVRMPLLGF